LWHDALAWLEWMDPSIPYLACVLGAVGLFLMLRPGDRSMRLGGAVLGLAAVAWLFVSVTQAVGEVAQVPAISGSAAFATIFSLIALASAVRMITHSRPVYSALYFIMVVLSSAGLFLVLEAEFMAFALIIVYAGAILITYMFVLMLSQQAPDAAHEGAAPEYDRVPREPLAACVVGFIMLALLSHMVAAGMRDIGDPPGAEAVRARTWQQLALMPEDVNTAVQKQLPGAVVDHDARGPVIHVDAEGAYVMAVPQGAGQSEAVRVDLPESLKPDNVQLVGLDLVAKFPVSLELAGVILLMAMFGAVVLARKQIELGEDEVREAAGMRRLALHSDDGESDGTTEGRR
jgi:NADH-quinone oxidoreductase subunit J